MSVLLEWLTYLSSWSTLDDPLELESWGPLDILVPPLCGRWCVQVAPFLPIWYLVPFFFLSSSSLAHSDNISSCKDKWKGLRAFMTSDSTMAISLLSTCERKDWIVDYKSLVLPLLDICIMQLSGIFILHKAKLLLGRESSAITQSEIWASNPGTQMSVLQTLTYLDVFKCIFICPPLYFVHSSIISLKVFSSTFC